MERDATVIDECVRRGIPVVTTIGGGYGALAWKAQFLSIARTLSTYGGIRGRATQDKGEKGKR